MLDLPQAGLDVRAENEMAKTITKIISALKESEPEISAISNSDKPDPVIREITAKYHVTTWTELFVLTEEKFSGFQENIAKEILKLMKIAQGIIIFLRFFYRFLEFRIVDVRLRLDGIKSRQIEVLESNSEITTTLEECKSELQELMSYLNYAAVLVR